MSISMSDHKDISYDSEAFYEKVASQEEIYLEKTQEAVRTILSSEAPSLLRNDNTRISEVLDEELDHATEQLISGDSDDPPLSEEAIADLLRTTQNG
jgi:hypothetical protein